MITNQFYYINIINSRFLLRKQIPDQLDKNFNMHPLKILHNLYSLKNHQVHTLFLCLNISNLHFKRNFF